MEETKNIFKKDIKNEVYLGISFLVIIFALGWMYIMRDTTKSILTGIGPVGIIFLVCGVLGFIRNLKHVLDPQASTKALDVAIITISVVAGIIIILIVAVSGGLVGKGF